MNSFKFAFIFLSLQILSTISITYGQTCEDSTEKFIITLDDGSQQTKSCYHAQKNPWGQCEKIEMQWNCPKTCSVCLGDIQCKIKVDLQFPQDESFTGYHSDFVHVQKEGQTEVCHSGNDKTNWGCTHVGGDAFIDGTGETFQKASSNVRIYDVRNAELKVGVSHRFSEKEVLQEMQGGLGRANLIIKVNNQMLTGSFRHEKMAKKHTHAGFDQVNALNKNIGFVDPTYNGDYFAYITCDNSCNCVIERKDAECRLSAQLKFPKIEETNYHGYHHDVVTVTNSRGNVCSIIESTTKPWCAAYGDALTLSFENEQYYDFNMASFIDIPDAAGDSFTFDISHVDGEESKYGLFPQPAQLEIYLNNALLTSLSHGESSGMLKVTCDRSCNCNF